MFQACMGAIFHVYEDYCEQQDVPYVQLNVYDGQFNIARLACRIRSQPCYRANKGNSYLQQRAYLKGKSKVDR